MSIAMKWDTIVTTLCCAFFTPYMSLAATTEHQRSHDDHHQTNSGQHAQEHGHVHGQAQLLIVMEGSALQVQFDSPAANVVGFEHSAHTTQEKAALARAQKLLAQPNQLFEFKPKLCQLTDYSTDFSGITAVDKGRESKQSNQNHNEITATYQYHCAQPQKLTSLTTTLTQQFHAIEHLQVQWLVNGRQAATTLDNRRHDITFR